MKIIKKLLLVILLLIAVFLIMAVFIKKDYAVEREIVINKPVQEVFDYVKLIKNHDNYHYWVMMDPTMKKSFTGTDGTVGFIYAWDSNDKNAGQGEQEIKDIKEGKSIDMEVRFIKPFEGLAYTKVETDPVGEGQTKVKWSMNGQSKYPMNFMNLFMNKMLGSPLDTTLANLKSILENGTSAGGVAR